MADTRPTEHQLTVERSARYFQLGDVSASTRDLWVVAHGYGQIASRFITVFDRLASGERVVVAPEALSRFYVERAAGETGMPKVGASWMTREDRLREIADYIAYLDAVYDAVMSSVDRSRVRLTALGFSQGVAAIARWITRGRARAERFIACGGLLPPELDDSDFATLRDVDVILIVGSRDEFATEKLVAQEESGLRRHGVPCRTIWFDGGHEVGKEVIERLADM